MGRPFIIKFCCRDCGRSKAALYPLIDNRGILLTFASSQCIVLRKLFFHGCAKIVQICADFLGFSVCMCVDFVIMQVND